MEEVLELLALVPRHVEDEPESWRAAEALLPDAVDAAAAADAAGVARAEAALLVARLAGVQAALGLYPDAERLANWALFLLNGEEHPDPRAVVEVKTSVARVLAACAALGGEFSKLNAAREVAEEALADSLRLHGEEHADSALAMGTLGAVHVREWRCWTARRLLRRALAIARRTMGAEDPQTQAIFDDLAAAYAGMGMSRRARRMREEAVKLRRYVYGDRHPRTLTALEAFGHALCRSPRQRGRGLELLEVVAARRIQLLGPDHPLTRESLNAVEPRLRFRAEARAKRGAWASTVNSPGRGARPAQDPRTLATISRLAYEREAVGDRPGARRLLETALAADRREHGARHWSSRRTARALLAMLVRHRDARGAFGALKAALGL